MTTVYLVRMTQRLRLRSGMFDPPHLADRRIIRAFRDRSHAERFVAVTIPVWQNPFDQPMFWNIHYRLQFWRWDEDMDEWERDIPLADLVAFIEEKGLPPLTLVTGDYDRLSLRRWWDNHKDQMTDAQKADLWRFLGIPPFRIDEVELED